MRLKQFKAFKQRIYGSICIKREKKQIIMNDDPNLCQSKKKKLNTQKNEEGMKQSRIVFPLEILFYQLANWFSGFKQTKRLNRERKNFLL